jgi:hypothetical protein
MTNGILQILSKIYDLSSRTAMAFRNFDLKSLARTTRGEISKRLLKEPLQKRSCGIVFPRNHKLYEEFNRKIQQFIEAGIIDIHNFRQNQQIHPKYYEKPIQLQKKGGGKTLHKKYLETTYKKSFYDGPKDLSWNDLKFCFVLWFCSLSPSK